MLCRSCFQRWIGEGRLQIKVQMAPTSAKFIWPSKICKINPTPHFFRQWLRGASLGFQVRSAFSRPNLNLNYCARLLWSHRSNLRQFYLLAAGLSPIGQVSRTLMPCLGLHALSKSKKQKNPFLFFPSSLSFFSFLCLFLHLKPFFSFFFSISSLVFHPSTMLI